MATVSDTSTYDGALAWLYGRINYERSAPPAYRVQNFKLERMRDLAERLGKPQLGLPIVHVAGTKGKGSTSSMLAAILTQAGYRTGLYTSPHLERTEERLAVDGVCCSPEELVELVRLVRPAVTDMDDEAAAMRGPGSPTYFEIMTAMALLHFARRHVQAVVLEVGLGGRLDSTNIVTPVVSVITSISFDHMKQLGSTLAAIAGEKAGIIKPGIPVVTGVEQQESLGVIQEVAAKLGAPLYRAGHDFQFAWQASPELRTADRLPRGTLSYRGRVGETPTEYAEVALSLIGQHQAANAAVALATVERLQEQGWAIPEAAIRQGLARVRCAARVEVLQCEPTVVIDTAHNPASIAALLEVLTSAQGFARRHLVFACSRDKEPATMLRQLWPHFDRIVLTRFVNNPRSLAPEELAELAPRDGHWPELLLSSDPVAAWHDARRGAGPDDLVCVTGSFFLAAELRGVILGT